MASFIVGISPRWNWRRLGEEAFDRAEQRVGRLHVRHVTTVLEHSETSIRKRARQRLGSLERNRVLTPVQNQHGTFYLFDALQEVEVTKTFPYLLLDATDHTKRCEVVRAARVGEVAGDRQLERALTICFGITLAKPGRCQLVTHALNRDTRLPLGEAGFEPRPKGARRRCRIDEDKPRRSRTCIAGSR